MIIGLRFLRAGIGELLSLKNRKNDQLGNPAS
jgi:hypothetical protein